MGLPFFACVGTSTSILTGSPESILWVGLPTSGSCMDVEFDRKMPFDPRRHHEPLVACGHPENALWVTLLSLDLIEYLAQISNQIFGSFQAHRNSDQFIFDPMRQAVGFVVAGM
ncbi:hypothetical protein Pan97_32840 [Bremerella volcania]|uniref:Uncharacterized protein n=1 Tax=Bremerella volcania TaxID=2527984 RepID=A0A518CAI5_9BACT|nr:hypothetical protein Pan97_32840 [Bremerella volcania]